MALTLVGMGLVGAAMAFVFGLVAAGAGAVYAVVAGPHDCSKGVRPTAELLSAVTGGHLMARRSALSELACAAPVSAVEFDLLVAAARQTDRRRLRETSVGALARAKSPELKTRALALAGDADEALVKAGLTASRSLGVTDDDPALAGVLARHPDWRAAKPAFLASPAAIARMRERASRAEALLARADLVRFPTLRADAVRAAQAKDLPAIERLLKDPTFLAAGAEAGLALAAAGDAFRPRARELSLSDDPAEQDVGLGALVAMGDVDGIAAAEKRRRAAL